MNQPTTLGFDLGNSRIKAAWLSDDELAPCPGFPLDSADELRSALRSLIEHRRPGRVALASTDPAKADRLLAQLHAHGLSASIDLRLGQALFDAGLVKHRLRTPETTGVDRALAVLAATKRFPNEASLVVDAGTAMTVNAIDAEQTFLGGAIIPGFGLMSRTLTEGTAALPEIDLESRPDCLGDSTISAMRSGIYYAAVGAVDRLLEELRETRSLGATPPVLVTGGNAKLLSQGLRTEHMLAPHLVLEGLRHVASHWPATS
ncbi:Type III pantothenate kinase [Planctomycetes bacterium Pan216]|uniref:Type III pantothenate kinase n=1 Tax=Kolteria novifilia TaxID=2527975 RepID=A0A518B824_9BACT|nr:Type III pantothenate kinase [Planctomycetes bacterium Pan216]